MKKIAILGSTGSIGTQTLEIVREQKDIEVVALCAGKNITLLEQQIREFRPRTAVLWDEADAGDLRIRVADLNVEVLSGMEGLITVATMEGYEILVTAIVGMLGLQPTVAAIKAGKSIPASTQAQINRPASSGDGAISHTRQTQPLATTTAC